MSGTQCIIFTGFPGTGTTSIAQAVARDLGIPVFAKDWLEATLIRCQLQPAEGEPPLGSAGYQCGGVPLLPTMTVPGFDFYLH